MCIRDRIIRDTSNLEREWEVARAEAGAAFGNPTMYMEKFCEAPRHIEVQVVGDGNGGAAHLGERECSIQRRHQKVVEEAPSFALSEKQRKPLLQAARKATASINYRGAGTLEFLMDSGGNFYFMEMNTRLQVEHPVTEMVTGVDLVREQVRIAAGEKLSFEERRPRGHSIELRVNAEDPETFAPWPGKITGLNLPGGFGVRFDTHIYEGYEVPPHYDSLLAKLIVHDETRVAAIARANRCLDETVIEGIRTNIPFLRRIINHPDFRDGNFDTEFVAKMLAGEKSLAAESKE